MGAFQYNSYDTAPTSKTDFLTLSGSVTGRPSDDHLYPLECDRSKNLFGNLLIRTAGVGDDLQKYDHATFNLATVGFQAEYPLGELWVSYDVVLQAPKTETSLPWYSTWDVISTDYHDPLGGRYLNLASMKSKNVSNTLHLTREIADNLECFAIPAGGSGLYRFTCSVWPSMVVDEAPKIDFMSVQGLTFNGLPQMPDAAMSVQKRTDDVAMVYSLNCMWDVMITLKDETKPGLFTVLVTGASGQVDGLGAGSVSYWSMQRLPDDMYIRGGTSGVVSQAKKFGKVSALLAPKPLSDSARMCLEARAAPRPAYWAEERKTSVAEALRPVGVAPRRA